MTRRAVVLSLLVVLGAACASTSPRTPSSSPSRATGPAIAIEGTWASASGPHAALVYFGVRNAGDADVLLGARSEVGGRAVLRESSSPGVTRPVKRLRLPAGGELSFEPGSYELELVGVRRPLRSGSVVRLTLQFAHAGEVEVRAGVR